MNKAMRRTFMAENDVVPSKQPWWRVTGREWPGTVSRDDITGALVSTRYARDAQNTIWSMGAAKPTNLFDHVEVWERDGKVVLVTSHVYEGEVKIEPAKVWAEASDVSFICQGREHSWHNADPDAGCHLFVFTRQE
jgi:hypothetical protein